MSDELKAQMEALKIDWQKLLDLAQKLPAVLVILQQLVQIFANPVPPAPMQAKGPDGCCDHKACCLAVLQSALCTAQLAAQHYDECCKEC